MIKSFKFLLASFVFISLAVPSISFAQSISPEISAPVSGLSCPDLSLNIYRGMKDSRTNGAVSDLQQFFSDKYGVDPDVLVTGFFGPKTESYVKRFQAENNIQQTGVAGPITRSTIRNACGNQGQVCTQDAKLCPDGSSVGRTGPGCSFAACPGSSVAMCDYAPAPTGCTYVRGSNYNPTTQCGMTLSCSSTSGTPVAMCDYVPAPNGCHYIQGSAYNSVTQCGMVLSCSPTQTCADGSVILSTQTCSGSPVAMCDYAPAPAGCTYVRGSNYNPTTQCGMTLSCSSTSGTLPTVTLSASPTSIAVGGSTNLTWSSSKATSCKLSSSATGELGAVPLSGTAAANQFASTATITLTCTGQGGSAQASVLITVASSSSSQPAISSLSPNAGPVGTSVRVNGSGFSTSENSIYLDGTLIEKQGFGSVFTPTTLWFTIPATTNNCPVGAQCFVGPRPVNPGVHMISVSNSAGTSNSVSFTVTGSSSSAPTASLTVNGGQKNITLRVGDPSSKVWTSSNGSTYDAYWSAVGTCSDAGKTNQHWSGFDGKNRAGDTENYFAQANQVGCTYTITYVVTSATGQTASDSISTTVIQ